MDYVINAIQSLLNFFISALSWLMDGFLYTIKAALYFIFDGLLTVVETLFSAINIPSTLLTAAGSWGLLPTQAVYCINAVGIPQGLAIIVSAIVIRMGINLIPAAFTRI